MDYNEKKMNIVVVEIWNKQPTFKIALKLGIDLGDLRKRTNVTGKAGALDGERERERER